MVSYFPAYEIMNDELRDYRFYKEDMLHPSEQAVEYIWQQFQGNLLRQGSRAVSGRLEAHPGSTRTQALPSRERGTPEASIAKDGREEKTI